MFVLKVKLMLMIKFNVNVNILSLCINEHFFSLSGVFEVGGFNGCILYLLFIYSMTFSNIILGVHTPTPLPRCSCLPPKTRTRSR